MMGCVESMTVPKASSCSSGTLLPAPVAVFPRYVGEAGEGSGKPAKPQKT